MKKVRFVQVIVAFAVASVAFAPSGNSERRAGSGVAEAQTATDVGYKLVRCGPQTRMDAVIVTKVTVAGQEVQCGLTLGPNDTQTVTPFQAGDDWLSRTDICVLNRTNKRLALVDVALGFPDTGNGRTEPQRIYDIRYGRMPDIDAYSHRTGKPFALDPKLKPAGFAPGQTLVLHVGDYIDEIKEYVEGQMPLPMVTRMEIHRGLSYFDDGMRWAAGGGFSEPVSDHPGSFKQLDIGRFFPGDPSENWPPSRNP